MRSMIVASALAAFAVALVAAAGGPATAAKSKMGCEVGKEYWDATQGKCVKGKAKKPGKKGE